MPFRLWPAQIGVLWKFLTHRLIIILKARQLGISWLCCIYALWLCVFHPGKVVLIFSIGQLEANEMLRRIKVLYERLPEWMIDALPRRIKDNTETQEWANGSKVRSLSAAGGRSFTASLAILDEAAHIQHANELYMQLKPTIDAGGQLIMLSSANGMGNLFHLLWVKSVAGVNSFITIFLPWWARPSRDRAWYERQKGEYTDANQIKQEYPNNANEAFVASGRVRCAPEWISKASAHVLPPVPGSQIPADLRCLVRPGDNEFVFKFWSSGLIGRRYVIVADIAEGNETGDWSHAVVLDAETWEQCAALHAHAEPDEFAVHMLKLQAHYPGSIVGWERNNHGHAVAVKMRTEGARNVYTGSDDKLGWVTTEQSKIIAIDLLAEALRDDLIKVRDQSALDEMQVYRILKNGSTGAPEGYHDDRVMAWAIALQVARSHKVYGASSFG